MLTGQDYIQNILSSLSILQDVETFSEYDLKELQKIDEDLGFMAEAYYE